MGDNPWISFCLIFVEGHRYTAHCVFRGTPWQWLQLAETSICHVHWWCRWKWWVAPQSLFCPCISCVGTSYNPQAIYWPHMVNVTGGTASILRAVPDAWPICLWPKGISVSQASQMWPVIWLEGPERWTCLLASYSVINGRVECWGMPVSLALS